jgi:hypothetical protein
MTNRVKYAPVRKYRDVGFNEPPQIEPRVRPRNSISIKKKKKNFFQRMWDKIKLLTK